VLSVETHEWYKYYPCIGSHLKTEIKRGKSNVVGFGVDVMLVMMMN
jgi:hypothetical protein